MDSMRTNLFRDVFTLERKNIKSYCSRKQFNKTLESNHFQQRDTINQHKYSRCII